VQPPFRVDKLRRLNAVNNVVGPSFDWTFLAAVHAFEPNLPLGPLGSGTFTASTLARDMNSGATIVAWELLRGRARSVPQLGRADGAVHGVRRSDRSLRVSGQRPRATLRGPWSECAFDARLCCD